MLCAPPGGPPRIRRGYDDPSGVCGTGLWAQRQAGKSSGEGNKQRQRTLPACGKGLQESPFAVNAFGQRMATRKMESNRHGQRKRLKSLQSGTSSIGTRDSACQRAEETRGREKSGSADRTDSADETKKTGDHEPKFHYNTSLTQAVRSRSCLQDLPYHPSSYTSNLRNLTHPKLHQVMTLPPSRVVRNHPARGSRPTLHPGFRSGESDFCLQCATPFLPMQEEKSIIYKNVPACAVELLHKTESELQETQTLRMKYGSNLSTGTLILEPHHFFQPSNVCACTVVRTRRCTAHQSTEPMVVSTAPASKRIPLFIRYW